MAGQFDHFNFLLAFLFTLEVAADTSSPSVEFAILNQVFCVARDFWTYNAASVSSTYPSQSADNLAAPVTLFYFRPSGVWR